MKTNARILGAALVGVSTCLLTFYVRSLTKQNKLLDTKKLKKEAVQSWEGEGGAIIERAPRSITN